MIITIMILKNCNKQIRKQIKITPCVQLLGVLCYCLTLNFLCIELSTKHRNFCGKYKSEDIGFNIYL